MAKPEHVQNKFTSETGGGFVGDEKVGAIPPGVGGDAFGEIGEAQAQHAPGLEHAVEFAQHGLDFVPRNFLEGMDADNIIQAIRRNGQAAAADIAAEIYPRPFAPVGVEPARLAGTAATPIKTFDGGRVHTC